MKKLTIFIIMIIASTSCSKYDDGPAFSFVSPTARITNSWSYSEVYRNGLDITQGVETGDLIYTTSSIGFAEDGRFSYIESYRDGDTELGDGFWEFTDNATMLKLIYDDTSKENRIFKITRLERQFMWLEETLEGNNTLVLRLTTN